MTVQDIFDAMSDYGFTDTSAIRKLEKINATVWDICSREAWPFLEKSVDLNFDGINAAPSNSPIDLQAVLDIVRTDTGNKLQPLRLQEADATMALQLTQVGPAYYYYFIGGALKIAQIPSVGNAQLRMRYIAKHPVLVQTDVEATILIPREHHEAILYGALLKLYDLEDDTDLSVRFQQLFEGKLQDMRSSIWMRQYDRPDHIVVLDSYDYDYDFYA